VLGRLALADGPVKRGAAHRSYREALRLLGGDDVEGARAALERAVAAEPSYTLALGSLAVVHLRAGRHEACAVVSAQCVERAFEAEHLGACYFNLGACLEHLGDEAGAYEALRASLEARDNEAAAKTVARLARRLRRPAAPATDRAEREGLVRRAAASYFESTCGRAAFPADRPGVATCGEAAAWGDAGAFSGAGRQEVLLAVADGGAAPEGFGVLMREVDGRFRVVARTRLLAPGRGGVDFLGRLRLVDGRDVSIVQSSSCEGGCCTGWVRALRAESQADGAAISATRLVPVGTTRTDDGQTVIQALVTGVRLLAGPDGPSPVLRYETRFGRANPDVSYLRVVERDGAAAIVGRFPAASAVPACRPVASDHGSPDAAATVAE
jgi:tetratricopeptide (TPR) repeat protein